jgi:hypothetical protein
VCIVKHIEGWLKICSWIIARFGWMLFLRTIVTFSTSFYGWLPFCLHRKIPVIQSILKSKPLLDLFALQFHHTAILKLRTHKGQVLNCIQ